MRTTNPSDIVSCTSPLTMTSVCSAFTFASVPGHGEALTVELLRHLELDAADESYRPVLVGRLPVRPEHEVLIAAGGLHQLDTGALDDRVRVETVDDPRGDRVHTLLDTQIDHCGEPDQSDRQRETGDSLPPWPPSGACRGPCRLARRRRPSSAHSAFLSLDGAPPRLDLVAILVHYFTLSGLPDVGNG